jgi:uncharacterized protein (DUF1778 family)
MRYAAINLRAKPEQRDLIDQAAAMPGKNRADFMLEAACDRAQSVLLDQVLVHLDDRRLKDVLRQLDALPVANDGMERLMALKPPCAAPGGKKDLAGRKPPSANSITPAHSTPAVRADLAQPQACRAVHHPARGRDVGAAGACDGGFVHSV